MKGYIIIKPLVFEDRKLPKSEKSKNFMEKEDVVVVFKKI